MRDARVVHEHVEAAKLAPDTFCRGGDRGLIGNTKLDRVRVSFHTLCDRFSTLPIRFSEFILRRQKRLPWRCSTCLYELPGNGILAEQGILNR